MNIASILKQLIVFFPIILFSLTVHEFAHGYVADKMGDPTAKMAGRLTFNPLPHIDPLGTIVIPLIFSITGFPFFAWAKPVPVNPNNMRDPKLGDLLVSAAGPVSNLLLATLLAFIWHFVLRRYSSSSLDNAAGSFATSLVLNGAVLNVLLAIFNILPIPPLDGSHVLRNILPANAAYQYSRLEPLGGIILLALLWTGVIRRIIFPVGLIILRGLFKLPI
ncbi:MAG: site-2 protease family protein [bacterium]